ncbi:MAG: M60 family metallopeptidase [Proteiniphilum sp.]|nr:M60 family metallopeptidase [Proteiniphilum sp.]MDD3909300.1 M60 family metallopeptidase [Proteiniphilum sp.]MDD4415817.1 M60 family metallopeptidase [Proteiniphilum sp.]
MKINSSLHPFIFVIAGIILFACSEKQDNIPPFLSIDTEIVNFSTTASIRDIRVKTSIENWTITVQPDAASWIKATRNGSILNIVVTENNGSNTRKGEIIIIADKLSATIIVEQLGSEPTILVSSATFNIPANGGDITLEITSNIEYDIAMPAEAGWIKPKPENRSGEMVKKEYRYQVGWNMEETERQAEIVIKQKNGTLEKKIVVAQKAQTDYSGATDDDVKDDIKVPVSRGTATSYQQGGEIEKSFDGNMNTLYHSSWNNSGSDYFPITLEYFFENQESIDYFIYYPRTGTNPNGNFKEVEIWTATKENPIYVKAMDFDFKGSFSATRISFPKPLVKPKSIKFVINSGAGDGQGFAACAEMEFYRFNPDNYDPLSLFTDLTCSELKPGITLENIEKVSNNLYRNIALYMLRETYPREFRIQNYRAWPHPDDWARANKTSQLSLLDNPTGISVSENEDIIVFVGETQGYTLSLKVQNLDTPGGDGYGNASYYPLSPGINKLKMRNKGLAYIFYHTTEYETAPLVKIHFATGKINGYFDSQKHQPSDWSKYLNAATDDYFDVLGKHAHLTFPTKDFKTYAAKNGDKLIETYDDLVQLEKEFMGLKKYNRPTVNRAYFHAIYTSYMYSTSYRTAYNVSGTDVKRAVLDINQLKSSPWGPAHEMGHTFQTRPGFKWHGMTEVTNNVHSLYVQTQCGNTSRIENENMGRFNNRYEKAYYNSFVNSIPHPGEGDVFCKLVSLWQLQLYFANAHGFTDIYKDLYEKVRTSPTKLNAGEQQLEFVKMMCDVTQTNLTAFFQKWGYLSPFDQEIDDYGKARVVITQNQINQTIAYIESRNYQIPTGKIEYICDSNWEVFKNHAAIKTGTAVKSGSKIEMTNWQNVVAYEVYEGSTLVFVTNKALFTLDSPVKANTKVYAVAYDGTKTEVMF